MVGLTDAQIAELLAGGYTEDEIEAMESDAVRESGLTLHDD